VTSIQRSTALLAVDVQRDFLPGGSLAVRDGDAVVAPLSGTASHAQVVVATRDFHPPHHISFFDRGGPWPVHCVAGSPGAELHPEVDRIADLIVSKGTDPDVEAYSGFDGTGLATILRALGIDTVLVGGLATDYCVCATAIAAQSFGFTTIVIAEAIRAVDVKPGDGEQALQTMRDAGVRVLSFADLGGVAAS